MGVDEAIMRCKEEGLLLIIGRVDSLRAVAHLDVSFEEINLAKKIINKVFS